MVTAIKVIGTAVNRAAVSVPDSVKKVFCGTALIALGVLSAVLSYSESGSYDITAALFIVPIGTATIITAIRDFREGIE